MYATVFQSSPAVSRSEWATKSRPPSSARSDAWSRVRQRATIASWMPFHWSMSAGSVPSAMRSCSQCHCVTEASMSTVGVSALYSSIFAGLPSPAYARSKRA